MAETLRDCPFLGMRHDSQTKTSFPSTLNCCHHAKPVAVVELSHQQVFCLTGKYTICPVFLQDKKGALPRELRGSYGGVSKPKKVRWPIALGVVIAILALVLTASNLLFRNQLAIPIENSSTSTASSVPQNIPDRMVIPAIYLDAPIEPMQVIKITIDDKEYDQYDAPDKAAAGWYIDSAALGQIGNTVISGQYDAFGKVFSKLEELEVGNQIRLMSAGRTFDYIITNTINLPEKNEPPEVLLGNARWILPSSDERITLVTCWLVNSNNHCLIIVAAPFKELHLQAETSVSLTTTPDLTATETVFPVMNTPHPLLPPNPTVASTPTHTPVPIPTDTPEPLPTDTPEPIPTDTPEPPPTDTPEPPPTDTPEPPPTDTPVPPPTEVPPEPTPE